MERKGERPRGHAAKITALVLAGYRLYTGDKDGMMIVWELSDGRGGRSAKKKKKTKKEEAAENREREKAGLTDLGDGIFVPPPGFIPSGECVLDVLDDHDAAITALAVLRKKEAAHAGTFFSPARLAQGRHGFAGLLLRPLLNLRPLPPPVLSCPSAPFRLASPLSPAVRRREAGVRERGHDHQDMGRGRA